MQIDPYKTPELQQSLTFLHTPPPTISSRDIKKSRKLIAKTTHCAICDEAITLNLAGERMIELTCGDFCHLLCYYLILPLDDAMLPVCPLCHTDTKCVNELLNRKYATQKLCDPETPVGAEKIFGGVSSQMLVEKEYTELEIGLQSYTPDLSPTSVRRKLDSFIKPIVEIVKNEQNECSGDAEPSSTSWSMRIKAPCIFAANEENKRKKLISKTGDEALIQNHILRRLAPVFASVVVQDFGGLVTFDFLEITVNGNDIGEAEVYLFESGIIVMQDEVDICMVKSSDFSSVVYSSSREFVLNLKSESIPEIKFQVNDASFEMYRIEEWKIVERWLQIVNKIIQREPNLSSYGKFNQITANGWDLVPTELRSYADIINEPELQANSIPIDSISSANIILCISLVNPFLDMSNTTYKGKIQSLLNSVLYNMSQGDKLGLIFTGVNPKGEASNQSCLLGYAKKNWESWKLIINEIEVFSNPNLFSDPYEELSSGLGKVQGLLNHIDISDVTVNKLVIFYFCKDDEAAEKIEHQLVTYTLLAEVGEKISTSIVTNTLAMLPINGHFEDPVVSCKCMKKISVEVITKSFEELDSSFLFRLYKNVYIPKISITLKDNLFPSQRYGVETTELEIVEFNVGEYFEKEINFQTTGDRNKITYCLNWLGNREMVSIQR